MRDQERAVEIRTHHGPPLSEGHIAQPGHRLRRRIVDDKRGLDRCEHRLDRRRIGQVRLHKLTASKPTEERRGRRLILKVMCNHGGAGFCQPLGNRAADVAAGASHEDCLTRQVEQVFGRFDFCFVHSVPPHNNRGIVL